MPTSSSAPVRPRSPLWIVVLGLACEEAMHPYRMQTLIKERGKDQVANVAQRNSVYQTIEALLRAGLIATSGTARDENRPERTLYEATPAGRLALRDWVRAGLATPAREFPEFPAVLSTPYGLDGTEDFAALLRERVAALAPRLAELEQDFPGLPRLFLLENEYMAAITRAEIRWLRSVIDDLEAGRIDFPTAEELRKIGPGIGGPSDSAIREMMERKPGTSGKAPTGKTSRPRKSRRRIS